VCLRVPFWEGRADAVGCGLLACRGVLAGAEDESGEEGGMGGGGSETVRGHRASYDAGEGDEGGGGEGVHAFML
jgi:hypothetical protein